MSESFDPYRKWLGILPKDQPPNHYRLLGIELFDDDPDVIEAAADQRMTHVRTYQTGQNSVWFSENSGNDVHDVGTKRPNALGLYDIVGNVWEWCEGGQIYGAAFFDTREGLGMRLHRPGDGENRRVKDVGFRVAADPR